LGGALKKKEGKEGKKKKEGEGEDKEKKNVAITKPSVTSSSVIAPSLINSKVHPSLLT